MNEHIRIRVTRGKLADIKRPGTNRLDIPEILRQRKEQSKRQQDKRGRANGRG